MNRLHDGGRPPTKNTHVPSADLSSRPAASSNESSRVLLVIGKALANLVAVTLRHGRHQTRACTNEPETRQLMQAWAPPTAPTRTNPHTNTTTVTGGGRATY